MAREDTTANVMVCVDELTNRFCEGHDSTIEGLHVRCLGVLILVQVVTTVDIEGDDLRCHRGHRVIKANLINTWRGSEKKRDQSFSRNIRGSFSQLMCRNVWGYIRLHTLLECRELETAFLFTLSLEDDLGIRANDLHRTNA